MGFSGQSATLVSLHATLVSLHATLVSLHATLVSLHATLVPLSPGARRRRQDQAFPPALPGDLQVTVLLQRGHDGEGLLQPGSPPAPGGGHWPVGEPDELVVGECSYRTLTGGGQSSRENASLTGPTGSRAVREFSRCAKIIRA